MPDFFDRLIDEIITSPDVPAGSALVRPLARVRAPRLIRPGRRLLVALALLFVPGTLGGLALAGSFDEPTISPQQWVEGRRVAPAVAVAPAQGALGILRRARVPSDALPASAAYGMTHSPEAANGVNPSLSRRAQGFPSGGVWLIPGNSRICLEAMNAQGLEMAAREPAPGAGTAPPPVPVRGANGTASCTSDANAAAGWSAGTGSTRDSPGMIFTAGTVPDGVGAVTVRVTGRGTLTLPVHENVYMAEIHGWPESVSFEGPSGLVTIGSGPDVIPGSGAGARTPGHADKVAPGARPGG